MNDDTQRTRAVNRCAPTVAAKLLTPASANCAPMDASQSTEGDEVDGGASPSNTPGATAHTKGHCSSSNVPRVANQMYQMATSTALPSSSSSLTFPSSNSHCLVGEPITGHHHHQCDTRTFASDNPFIAPESGTLLHTMKKCKLRVILPHDMI